MTRQYTGPVTTSHDFTVEEMGVDGKIWVDFTIHFTAVPSEPEVRYYRDGSGYPGSPAYAELERVECQMMGEGECWGRYAYFRCRHVHAADWFELLDRIIHKHVETRWEDEYEQDCLESLADYD